MFKRLLDTPISSTALLRILQVAAVKTQRIFRPDTPQAQPSNVGLNQ